VSHELAQSVSNISNRSHKNQFFGEMVRLAELVKGNVQAVNGVSNDDLVDSHMRMYTGKLKNNLTSLDDGSFVGDMSGTYCHD
jgi:hypothetical protein